jgi:16S rRNA pseudouridine516 synthase
VERTKKAKLEIEKTGLFQEYKEELVPLLSDIQFQKTEKLLRSNRPVLKGQLTITEGRKHQVKRMLQAYGCQVIYLKRISIGRLKLDETLEKGRFRLLSQEEIQSLK